MLLSSFSHHPEINQETTHIFCRRVFFLFWVWLYRNLMGRIGTYTRIICNDYIHGHRGLGGCHPLPPARGGAKNCNRKNTIGKFTLPLLDPTPPWRPQSHPPGGPRVPMYAPGNHNVPWWKISMQKCIKCQIYTIPFWPSENLLETLEKNFAAKRLKMRFFENRFWPPPPPQPRPPLGVRPCPPMQFKFTVSGISKINQKEIKKPRGKILPILPEQLRGEIRKKWDLLKRFNIAIDFSVIFNTFKITGPGGWMIHTRSSCADV